MRSSIQRCLPSNGWSVTTRQPTFCAAAGRRPVALSYAELAVETGLSRASVQTAVGHLRRRQLLHAVQASRTAVPAYTVLCPWRRRPGA